MEMARGPLAGQNKCQFCLGPFTLRASKRLKVLWARGGLIRLRRIYFSKHFCPCFGL